MPGLNAFSEFRRVAYCWAVYLSRVKTLITVATVTLILDRVIHGLCDELLSRLSMLLLFEIQARKAVLYLCPFNCGNLNQIAVGLLTPAPFRETFDGI